MENQDESIWAKKVMKEAPTYIGQSLPYRHVTPLSHYWRKQCDAFECSAKYLYHKHTVNKVINITLWHLLGKLCHQCHHLCPPGTTTRSTGSTCSQQLAIASGCILTATTQHHCCITCPNQHVACLVVRFNMCIVSFTGHLFFCCFIYMKGFR